VPRTRPELIESLVADLQPARGPRRVETLVLLWLLASWSLVLVAILSGGPFRPGWLQQLAGSPRFLLESALGLGAGTLAILAAVQLGVPGTRLRPWATAAGAGLLLWLGAYVLGLFAPALDPSMQGKREGCWMEVLLCGVPTLLLGLALLRRLAPLSRAWTGALLGAAAGALPGLLMQLACMYVPAHILSHHLAPIAVVAGTGALLGAVMLRRI
jgi:hypothetical protein